MDRSDGKPFFPFKTRTQSLGAARHLVVGGVEPARRWIIQRDLSGEETRRENRVESVHKSTLRITGELTIEGNNLLGNTVVITDRKDVTMTPAP